MTDTGTNRQDSELVTAHLAGDRTALAAIYDRYADQLHDTARAMLSDDHEAEDATHDVFLIASRRLGQVRDPARLRPWLFAVLRNEVYRRSERRRRTRPTDFDSKAVPEMAAPDDPRAEAADIELAEAAAFVRAAATGLAERDQLVLELSARQGLAGADLADALGVTQQQCHVLVNRMRDRAQRSIGALTVARYGRKDCPDLQRLLATWDGTFGPRIRKRIAGHIDDCDACSRTSRRFAVLPMLPAAPAFAAPTDLRDRVLGDASTTAGAVDDMRFDAASGFPGIARSRHVAVVLAVAAAILLVVSGGAWLAIAESGDDAPVAIVATTDRHVATTSPATSVAPTVAGTAVPATTVDTLGESTVPVATVANTTIATVSDPQPTTPPPPAPPPPPPPPPPAAPPRPGQLVLSSATIDLGSTSTRATLSLANTGEQPLDWSLGDDPTPFIWSATGGRLEPGATTNVQISVDRGRRAEGTVSADVTVLSSADGAAAVALRASVERPPTLTVLAAPSSFTCPGPGGLPVLVEVIDETPLSGVELRWSGPGVSGSTAMIPAGGDWEALLTPEGVNGNWTWTAVATDARGNSGRIRAPFVVTGC